MTLADIVQRIRHIYQVSTPAQQDTILQNEWALITAVVMAALNHPEDISLVYQIVVQDIERLSLSKDMTQDLTVKVTMKLRDSILKGYVASGFPKTINGLQHLHKATPKSILELLPTTPIRSETTWDQIYDRHTVRVMQSMHTMYPDLAQSAHHHLYSPLLSECAITSGRETSLIVVAGCFVQNVPSQLRGHIYGALNNGATKTDIERVHETVLVLCRHYGAQLPPHINAKL
ncbi:hypothetical protein DM01DRAFT_1304536 [Hesseltinella vesiculosa]|uniref:Carboxymuconolactone decarboxylase-like domain-containing protein n=1 Tax=Hesseltinella vesiculosa TaxID=101127 RepID=A0A1X2GJ59_9FUNG|nr:hypothetical protein DM01DRAFT_1304536 [Hesseltinella vesiculosa]